MTGAELAVEITEGDFVLRAERRRSCEGADMSIVILVRPVKIFIFTQFAVLGKISKAS